MYVWIWQVATCFSTISKYIMLGTVLYSHAFRFESDSRWLFSVCWFTFASPIPANVNIVIPSQVNAKWQGKDTVKAHSTRLLVSGCPQYWKPCHQNLSIFKMKVELLSSVATQGGSWKHKQTFQEAIVDQHWTFQKKESSKPNFF